jgi:hypothetical protein
MHGRARLIVPRIVVSGVRNDISDTRQRKLLDAESRHLPRQTTGTRHPEHWNPEGFPASTYGLTYRATIEDDPLHGIKSSCDAAERDWQN